MPRDLNCWHTSSGARLTLRTTEDDSRTRLQLNIRTAGWAGATAELSVWDIQLLSRELLQWLADEGHLLPELDLPELEPDEDAPSSVVVPATFSTAEHVVPEFGELTVRQDGDAVVIDRADEWIQCTRELWDRIAEGPFQRWTTLDGDVLTLTDSDGRHAVYRRREDVHAGPDAWALQRTAWRPFGVPEHMRLQP